MKRSLSHFVAAIVLIRGAVAQTPPPPTSAPGVSQSAPNPEDDRFPALRDNADRLRAAYDKIDAGSMDEVERLLKTHRCQISRVGGLLDRTIEALRAYYQAELTTGRSGPRWNRCAWTGRRRVWPEWRPTSSVFRN
jgi:hypothetical protein